MDAIERILDEGYNRELVTWHDPELFAPSIYDNQEYENYEPLKQQPMIETMKTKDLPGATGFLNGEPGLDTEMEEKLFNYLVKHKKEVRMLDNLFKEPAKLLQVRECCNLVVFTTGLMSEKVQPLLNTFKGMGYVPTNVIFASDSTAEFFAYTARELKEEYGTTRFWHIDLLETSVLREIPWI